MFSPFATQSNTVPTNDEGGFKSSVSYALAESAVADGSLPKDFPVQLWNDQQARYARYWAWYSGAALDEQTDTTTQSGEPILRYPLQINFIRDFVDKHTMVCMGETDESMNPLVNPAVYPKPNFDGSEPTEDQKKKAKIAENILKEIWKQSGGRASQLENMKLAQAMGGGVFKAVWQPWRKEHRIPIFVEKVLPDHFLPIWNPKNYLDLVEVYEVYRIPGAVARRDYGVNTEKTWCIYYEHWTKKSYSIFIDSNPISVNYGDINKVMRNVKNPWGFIPYAYAPGVRSGGSFYGTSIPAQVEGVIKEYNSRMADNGDAVRDTVHRKRYVRNTSLKTVEEKRIAPGTYAIDLGAPPPGVNHEPDSFTEDPPNFSDSLMDFATDDLWTVAIRMGNISPVMYGEDEGSQRSALTMAFRMWPATSRATQTRTFWSETLNWFDYILLVMVVTKAELLKLTLTVDDLKDLDINQQWYPMIPRDREQLINEIVLLLQAGAMDVEEALDKRGDVVDKEGQIKRIKEWLEFKANLGAELDPGTGKDMGIGSGAKGEAPIPTLKTDTGTDK